VLPPLELLLDELELEDELLELELEEELLLELEELLEELDDELLELELLEELDEELELDVPSHTPRLLYHPQLGQ
jgi:hypothetical protein